MMISYDIYDRFTMEHFPLRQSMILTTSFFLLATVLTLDYPSATRRHGNFAGVHTLLRILLSNYNSAVLVNIITGISPPHFDFVVYSVLCQC
jgi:hypothetical protein